MKKVLYISYDGMTDALGQSQVLPYIIGLSERGYSFHLISFEKKIKFEKVGQNIEQLCSKNNINWYPQYYTKTPPVLSTMYDLIKLQRLSSKLVREKGIDFLHCRSYLPSLIALKIKKKSGVPFIFDMRGFWGDERVEGNIWSLSNPVFKWIYNFFKKKEKEFFIKSEHIISLTQSGKDEILSWNLKNLKESKFTIIPCCSDFSLFQVSNSKSKEKAKKELGIKQDDFVLGYIGSTGTWYLMKEMFRFFKVLKRNYSNAKFIIFTGDSSQELIRQAKELDIESEDLIIQFKPRDELAKLIDAFDFSLNFIKPSFSKKASSPTKMAELLAKGIPVISNKNVGDVEKLTKKLECGFVVDSFEDKYLNSFVSNEIKNAKFDPMTIRENAKSELALENAIVKYANVYSIF